MSEIDRELAEAVILGHYRSPKNKGRCEAGACGDTTNPACGDEITLSIDVGQDGVIACVRFEGQGCAVSQAGASLVTTALDGASVQDSREKLESFLAMMEGNGDPVETVDAVGEIGFLGAVRDNPARAICANLAARLALRLLGEKGR